MAHTLITDRKTTGSSYKILRRLGKGGMAEVFLARQEGMAGLRRLTVIKKILPQLSEMQDVAEMLLDEARIAAQLTHPNIVQIYELGQEEGQYFIAMEFVDGCDLATLARIERHRQGRIPLRLTLRVMSEAAMALDYAHRQVSLDGRPLNLVHRDVSPHNILCSRDGAVKVTDFGISKFAGKHQLTQVGVVKGKVQYMSPEQYRGAAVDHRSDIFSMGVVLYQLTVGKLPRVTESGQVAIKRVVEGNIPRPTSLRAEYPEELEDIVMRALANNPQERYPDAASLRDDLLDFAREHDMLAFPKELGEYVNKEVPPSKLVVEEKSVMGVPAPGASGAASNRRRPMEPVLAQGRQLPSVIVGEELGTEGPPGTEVASDVGRHRKLPPRRRPDPPEQHTEIPITSNDASGSEPAVLPDEQLTPLPFAEDDSELTPLPMGLSAAPDPQHPPGPADRLTPHPVRTDQILAHEPAPVAPAPAPAPRAQTAPPYHAEPPPQMLTQPRIQKKGGISTVTLLIVTGALLLGAGSLAYIFVGDRLPLWRGVQGKQTPARARVGAGVINIQSKPTETSVSIDGAKRCLSTPCRVAGLPLGRELLLTLRAEGHSLWMQRVVLTRHNPKLLLRADLTPIPGYVKKTTKKKAAAARARARNKTAPRRAPGGTRVSARKPGSAPTPRTPRRAPTRAPAGKRGKPKNITISDHGGDHAVLVVDVRPWAEVWLDGQKLGHTPLQKVVPVGKHRVVLKNAGHKYEKAFSIRSKKGKKVKVIDVIPPPSQ